MAKPDPCPPDTFVLTLEEGQTVSWWWCVGAVRAELEVCADGWWSLSEAWSELSGSLES